MNVERKAALKWHIVLCLLHSEESENIPMINLRIFGIQKDTPNYTVCSLYFFLSSINKCLSLAIVINLGDILMIKM